jgi:hypothetical protein
MSDVRCPMSSVQGRVSELRLAAAQCGEACLTEKISYSPSPEAKPQGKNKKGTLPESQGFPHCAAASRTLCACLDAYLMLNSGLNY